jgi:hypothetical protein
MLKLPLEEVEQNGVGVQKGPPSLLLVVGQPVGLGHPFEDTKISTGKEIIEFSTTLLR